MGLPARPAEATVGSEHGCVFSFFSHLDGSHTREESPFSRSEKASGFVVLFPAICFQCLSFGEEGERRADSMTGIPRTEGRRLLKPHVPRVHPLLVSFLQSPKVAGSHFGQEKFSFSSLVLEASVWSATCRPNPGSTERGTNHSSLPLTELLRTFQNGFFRSFVSLSLSLSLYLKAFILTFSSKMTLSSCQELLLFS